VIDWLGQKGTINIANIISLIASETELLVADKVPSEALGVLQKTLEILVEGFPHPSTDLSDDLVVKFCKLYWKVDNAWSTIWLKYQLRPIHERLLGANSVYSSAWSQIRSSDGSPRSTTRATSLTGNLPSDILRSENPHLLSNEIGVIPTGDQPQSDGNDVTSVDCASGASLFQPPTNRSATSAVLPLEDPEMELMPVAADGEAESEAPA
jgi:hypothetical protein